MGKIGKQECLNKNCWLVKNLNYSPYKRCQHCELKFNNCLFLQYQVISLVFIFSFLVLSFLIEGEISEFVIISIFLLIIVYGYFFNNSTDKIIQANYIRKKTNEKLEDLSKNLYQKVEEQTEELEKSYQELKVLDKAKSEFISMASHQLRTPSTAIKGYISMLIEGSYGELPAKAKEKMELVFHSNERMIKIVNDLLNISRIELGKIELEKSPTQIEELIKACCAELIMEAEKKGLKLIFKEPAIPLPKLDIDSSKIKQVISNLIDNAIKYTQKGEIEINISVNQREYPRESASSNLGKKDSLVLISVKDSGDGLKEEEKKRIFEGFTRGEAGIANWVEGTGLGLYVAKKFLSLHNGRIWAESPGQGKGSTFFVELPNI